MIFVICNRPDRLNFGLNSQGITKPKEIRKFKGEGMPLYQSNKKGDLYVTFEVLFPKTLTADQKAKLKDVLV
jgi:DnaJ homolog subfamily B member 11